MLSNRVNDIPLQNTPLRWPDYSSITGLGSLAIGQPPGCLALKRVGIAAYIDRNSPAILCPSKEQSPGVSNTLLSRRTRPSGANRSSAAVRTTRRLIRKPNGHVSLDSPETNAAENAKPRSTLGSRGKSAEIDVHFQSFKMLRPKCQPYPEGNNQNGRAHKGRRPAPTATHCSSITYTSRGWGTTPPNDNVCVTADCVSEQQAHGWLPADTSSSFWSAARRGTEAARPLCRGSGPTNSSSITTDYTEQIKGHHGNRRKGKVFQNSTWLWGQSEELTSVIYMSTNISREISIRGRGVSEGVILLLLTTSATATSPNPSANRSSACPHDSKVLALVHQPWTGTCFYLARPRVVRRLPHRKRPRGCVRAGVSRPPPVGRDRSPGGRPPARPADIFPADYQTALKSSGSKKNGNLFSPEDRGLTRRLGAPPLRSCGNFTTSKAKGSSRCKLRRIDYFRSYLADLPGQRRDESSNFPPLVFKAAAPREPRMKRCRDEAGITPCCRSGRSTHTGTSPLRARLPQTTERGNCPLGSSEPLPLTLFASGSVISSDALRFKCHQEDRDNAFCS
ncbi:hypothetical protein Bbelb_384270 [Branchiostoma belcheri]|nr:hypothetical protein Bbelb_384270 [Branchiostoma belcheri]